MSVFPSHPGATPPPQESPDISLGKLVSAMLDHKWMILLTALLFLLGGYFYASSQPRIYQADALIQIENRGAGLGVLDSLAVGNQMANPTSAEMEILQSRLVMGDTVDRLDLAIEVEPRRLPWVGDFLVHHGMTRAWVERLTPSALLEELPWVDARLVDGFVWHDETLEVSRFEIPPAMVGREHLLRVTGPRSVELWQGGQRILAGDIGDTLQDDSGYRLFIGRLEAHPGAEFTVRRVSRLSAIGKLQQRFTIVPRGNGSGVFQLTLNGPDQQRIDRILATITGVFLTQNVQRQSEEAEKQLAFLDAQIPQVNEQLTAAENRLNTYRAERDSVDLNFETRNLLNSLVEVENQLTALSLTESDLAERFRPGHPNYQALLRQRAQLMQEKARLEAQVNLLPETQQEVLRMTRDTEVNQQIYVQLLNQRQEMRLLKAGTVGNVRILDEAVLLRGTIAPKVALVSIASALFGALLAMVVVVLKLVLSRAVESPDQLEELGLPVYAVVPASDQQTRLARRIRSRQASQGQNVFRGLLADRDPNEVAVESLRALRTSLYFAMLESGDNRLMIAGASPEVGKSFVSANLAAVCAQAGQRVLLVDADMRRGHLHHAFHERGDNGLSDLLAQRIGIEDAIRSTAIEGLDYIARGSVPPNPSELLMQRGFHDFLEAMSRRYELVVLDTPPVLAVTDATVAGKLAGTSLLVVRYGRNSLKEVRAAKRRLEHGGVSLKGTILNGIEKTATGRYGYGDSYLYAYR
ncbi:Putative tyrosine-protein kinase in cps region [Halomonas sp. THAF5a]|uniref:polysaccharide biosynthesis tyrosine autokinase n=1 Tax=Halomonas sp. THAF5a TaxID=2587844 RepID=UPI001267D26A|nr:polysaccharide biosynthesis tyrosine autokinase [Halomonas sp. THAF5a]QFU01518.1 Putative tyrosine-protein kinase in cps region [Halomonas sp. THAF5a]